jgi:hypothetical protein
MSLENGRSDIQFHYRHNSPETNRINPSVTNIIDIFLVVDSYHNAYVKYIQDTTNTITEPSVLTISELTVLYKSLQDNKMLSDNIILNSVRFKSLFGSKSESKLQAEISVVKERSSLVSDSEIKSRVISSVNEFFDIGNWDFGDTFYFSELSAYLHDQLGDIIGTVVLIPKDSSKKFGDLYEIRSKSDEIFISSATVDDVNVIDSLTSTNLNGA